MLLEIKNLELLQKYIDIYIETGNEDVWNILKDVKILPSNFWGVLHGRPDTP